MPDDSVNNIAIPQTNPATNPVNSPIADPSNVMPQKPASSPWEEELPPEPPKDQPKIIGSLEKEKAKDDAKPFTVPTDLDEKVGKKMPAEEFITSNKQDPRIQPPPIPAKAPSVAAPATSPPVIKSAPAPVSDSDLEGFDWFSGPKNIPVAPASVAPTTPAPPPATPQNLPPLQPVRPASPANIIPLAPLPPKATPAFSSPMPDNPNSPVGVNQAGKAQLTGESFQENREPSRSKRPIFLLVGIIAILFVLIGLTEMGFLSIGLEKVYGKIGMEKLWGGLSINSEQALGKSMVIIQSHPNYKIKGTITFNVDSTTTSPITEPLISIEKSKLLATDSEVGGIIERAIKAATTPSIDDYYVQDSTSSSAVSSTAPTTAPTTATPTVNSADTAAATATEVLTPKYKAVSSEVIFSNSAAGSEAEFDVKNDSATSKINVVSTGEKLWVKTDGNIKFGNNENTDKWLEYSVDQMKGKSLQNVFSAKQDSGMTVTGVREGNEKVDGERCYKYRIDKMEIGSALSSIGISSDMVQSVSGEAWIGIKSKLIKKVALDISPSASSTASLIKVDLQFSDYDVLNTITKIDSDQTISSSEKYTGDVKRKDDVTKILAALSKYKVDSGSYPIADSLLKLNTSGNIIETALVPKYLASLPKDPKDADGWYYAYKSDGKTCSLSAKLEDATDPDGQMAGTTFLYLKYNSD